MKKIILHMGMHKTGSSSIQQTLYHNTKILEKYNIKVIKEWPNNNSVPIYTIFSDNPYNYHMNIKNNMNKNDIDNYIENNLSILKNYLNSNDTLIISGEGIRSLNKNALMHLKKYLINNCSDEIDLNIIMYIRNPIKYLPSAYQQQIKDGFNIDLNNIKLKSTYNKFKIITNVFGIDNIKLKSFEDTFQNENGVVEDFFKEIGIDNTKKIKYIKSNESISWLAFDILKYINSDQPMIINKKKNKMRSINDDMYIKKIRGQKASIDWDKNKYDFTTLSDELYYIKDNYNIDYTDILDNKVKNNFINKEITHDMLKDIFIAYRQSNSFIKNKLVEFFKANLNNYNYKNNSIKKELESFTLKKINHTLYIEKVSGNILYYMNDLKISRTNMIENLEKDDKIKFIATGNDPFFVVANTFAKSTLNLSIKLNVPNDTIFQVFYTSKNINFGPNTVVTRKIKKGINHFLIQINNYEAIEKIRIDPGNISGEYTIEELNIFA